MTEFAELLGKTLVKVDGLGKESGEVYFRCEDGTIFKMYHQEDCCETVEIEDVCGEVEDLINSPILLATETSKHAEAHKCESCTWTFYNISTLKGSVTIRWHGQSNGYYSESVSFKKVEQPK